MLLFPWLHLPNKVLEPNVRSWLSQNGKWDMRTVLEMGKKHTKKNEIHVNEFHWIMQTPHFRSSMNSLILRGHWRLCIYKNLEESQNWPKKLVFLLHKRSKSVSQRVPVFLYLGKISTLSNSKWQLLQKQRLRRSQQLLPLWSLFAMWWRLSRFDPHRQWIESKNFFFQWSTQRTNIPWKILWWPPPLSRKSCL